MIVHLGHIDQPPVGRQTGKDHALAGQNVAVGIVQLETMTMTLLYTIRHPAGASLIFVYGPTGMGKTTLRFRIEKQLAEESLPDLEQDPGRISVVGLEVVSPESGSFSWKDYHIRALIALDDPVFAHKIDYDTRASTRSRNGQYVIAQTTSIAELRRVLEGCLRYRRPVAFINDEAQHFKKTASGRRLLDQMDTLKSLAEVTDTVYVLIGIYEMLDLTNLSAQLSRRSVEIHFPRYRWDDPKDMSVFRNMLLTFQHYLPFNEEPDLLGNCDYLHEGCLGCVGIQDLAQPDVPGRAGRRRGNAQPRTWSSTQNQPADCCAWHARSKRARICCRQRRSSAPICVCSWA